MFFGGSLQQIYITVSRPCNWSSQHSHCPSLLRQVRASVNMVNAHDSVSNNKEPNAATTFFWSVICCCQFHNALVPQPGSSEMARIVRDYLWNMVGRARHNHSKYSRITISSRKNILSMKEDDWEEFVPSLSGRPCTKQPDTAMCGLLIKYLISHWCLFIVYWFVIGRQQTHICQVKLMLSCWLASVHRSKQQLPEPEVERETGEIQWGEHKKLLATHCQISSGNDMDIHLSAQLVTVYVALQKEK